MRFLRPLRPLRALRAVTTTLTAALLAVVASPAHAASAGGGTDAWPWSNVINSLATNGVQIVAGSMAILMLIWGIATARQDGESGIKRIGGAILLASVAIGAPAVISQIQSLVGALL